MKKSEALTKAKQIIAEAEHQSSDLSELSVELAACLLTEANQIQSSSEFKQQQELMRMMQDPVGKIFTTSMTDQCFRSENPKRVADQIRYLLHKYGVPKYLSTFKRLSLYAFRALGSLLPSIFVPLTKSFLRQETASLIMPGEPQKLLKHIEERKKERVRINLNHLGEAILGEEEAQSRLSIYLEDLKDPSIDYISVKISTLYSQINLIAWEETLEILSDRFRQLLRQAKTYSYIAADGKKISKFVNLDMEEYRDLELTVALFKKVLNESDFVNHSAGIVLQAYLPDSFSIQKNLTEWAEKRIDQGGAPIKIRIVKGANLAMEQVESSIRGWPQAPFTTKAEVDANFKQMITYGLSKKSISNVKIGVGSHNLFDIAYALLLAKRNGTTAGVTFEMLEGMADPQRRVVQLLKEDALLYCPAAKKEEFQNAVAYLVRRLDENTADGNFLKQSFGLKPDSSAWKNEARKFQHSIEEYPEIGSYRRRDQSRLIEEFTTETCCRFENEPDTDFSLKDNRKWAESVLDEWKDKPSERIPLMINGKEREGKVVIGFDPSLPNVKRYEYSQASLEDIEEAIEGAVRSFHTFKQWSVEKRVLLLRQIANRLRERRGLFIGVMAANTGKTVLESDPEISEAIDFADYYANNLSNWQYLEELSFEGKGPVLILPPWNFPCSIPAGGILAALAAGCSVLFKPAPEATWVGWELAKAFWDAGVPKEVLQFIPCADDPEGTFLVKDERIKSIILTGASETAVKLSQIQKGFKLFGETGGKNAIIVSSLADRDLAVKDIIQSAFGYSGQKCSACSLVILFREVYEDPIFKKQLKDATLSLKVGSPWEPDTKVGPLISTPSSHLEEALTTLKEGEEWLVPPVRDKNNPNLLSPSIKWGVSGGSEMHLTEFFAPVLSVMCADSLEEAIDLVNQVPYGLTSGLHSLDEREQLEWTKEVVAGNLYINRTITGAVVQRQPFGGTKDSQFGMGAKAGGPNYLLQLMNIKQHSLPILREEFPNPTQFYKPNDPETFKISLESYTYFWNHYFSKKFDPSLLLGQDNLFYYLPHRMVFLRISLNDDIDDVMRIYFACQITRTPLEISHDPELKFRRPGFIVESEEDFIIRIKNGPEKRPRVRLISSPSAILEMNLANLAANVHLGKPLYNGRVEMLNYLREVSLSHDYHRYGNLGDRENELRAPLPVSYKDKKEASCCGGSCPCR